jgi:hypothetical protein
MTDQSGSVSVGDFRRPPAGEPTPDSPLVAGATYRVVGIKSDASTTLLRVTDATGSRQYTGDVVPVSAATLAATEPVSNPDAGLALGHRLRNLRTGLYWSVRRFFP